MAINWDVLNRDKLTGPERLPQPQTVDGVLWLPGRGTKPARVLVVGQNPGELELQEKKVFVGPSGQLLKKLLARAGLAEDACYITNAVKHGTFNNATPKITEIRAGQNCLLHEIEDAQPEIIIMLGAVALEAVAGRLPGNKPYSLSGQRGEFFTCERFKDIRLLATYHPAYILRSPEHEHELVADLAKVAQYLKSGATPEQATAQFDVIASADAFGAWLLRHGPAAGSNVLCVDSEWQGQRPGAPGAYLRTLQAAFHNGQTAVVRFYPEADLPDHPLAADQDYPDCAKIKDTLHVLGWFLSNAPQAGVFGQNLSSDGLWFLHYGLDLRPYTIYDTMLAEHIIDNRGPFNLTDLTLKYVPEIGRYDRWVQDWLNHNPAKKVDGFGAVPEQLLFPYGAFDVQVPWKIMARQSAILEAEGMTRPTGLHGEYPSLLTIELKMAAHLYEIHLAGMLVDRQRLGELTELFNQKRDALRIQLADIAAKNGFPDFNPNSHQQKLKLLYGAKEAGGLALQPIKSTGKRSKSWDWVKRQHQEMQKYYNPAVDGETLEMLRDASPVVDLLIRYQQVGTICKNFLRDDEEGGIAGNIWPDGKVHSDFSQLSDTGRLRSSHCNMQNLPKASEGDLRVIFKDDRQRLIAAGTLKEDNPYPPSIRSVFVPEPGCILMEADYKQAELFVLAGLAQDDVMLDALRTPGKDLHDLTTISSFHISVLMPDGTPYNEAYALELAARDYRAFEKFQKELIYVDAKNRRMSRTEFKNTIRVSGKSINFGISYGRGPEAIARQVNALTGMNISVDEIQDGIEGWKTTFAKSWSCMCQLHQQAVTDHFVSTVWGRKRRFNRPENNAQRGQVEREGSNHPIQGTVADTVAIAIDRIVKLRAARGLTFKIVNQVHDALLFNVPLAEVAATEEVARIGMSEIDLPMPGGPLRLSIDIEKFERWNETD